MTIIAAQGMLMSSGGGGAPTVAWNPSDKSVLIDLSNNNLTATRASAVSEWKCARATTAHNSGKYYFEVEVDIEGANGVEGGLAMADFNINTGVLDSSPYAWAFYNMTGQPYHNGAAIGSALGAIGNGQRMGFAVDFDAGKIWVSRLGTFSGDPAAGTGERFTFTANTPLYPACALYVEFSQLTGAFRDEDFDYTVPTGFSAWES